jgi:hypothetical protein
MSTPKSRRFPVTVSRLPLIRCQLCQRTMACRTGEASTVLTGHYRREHPGRLQAATGAEAQQPLGESGKHSRESAAAG